jgi:hypothetical protein
LYRAETPELEAEIAVSSVSIEWYTKLQIPQRSGVREYLVWRAPERVIDWFMLG